MITNILKKWEAGCFYTTEYLAQAYSVLLTRLWQASDAERADTRIPEFLLAGYEAYILTRGSVDPLIDMLHRTALGMSGAGAPARLAPVAAPPGPVAAVESAPVPDTPPVAADTRPHLKLFSLQNANSAVSRQSSARRRWSSRDSETHFPRKNLWLACLTPCLPVNINPSRPKRTTVSYLKFIMRRVDQLSGQVILDKLTRVLNSNQSFMADGQLTVSYIRVPTPEGGGRSTTGGCLMRLWITGLKG